MDAKRLVERAAAAVARPDWPRARPEGQERAPAVPNLPAFFDREGDRVVVFVGEAAGLVRDALDRGHDATPKLARLVRRLPGDHRVDGVPVLRLALGDWNEYLPAIAAAGYGVTELALEE